MVTACLESANSKICHQAVSVDLNLFSSLTEAVSVNLNILPSTQRSIVYKFNQAVPILHKIGKDNRWVDNLILLVHSVTVFVSVLEAITVLLKILIIHSGSILPTSKKMRQAG